MADFQPGVPRVPQASVPTPPNVPQPHEAARAVPHSIQPPAAPPTTPVVQSRVFAPYIVYKRSAAMQVSLVPPKFKSLSPSALALEKPGGMSFEFANSTGERQYDWSTKGNILLNPTEAAELLCGRGEISFYHDPNKGRQGEGTVVKKMTVVGINDNSGYFFNLSVSGSGKQAGRYAIKVSHAEFEVLKAGVTYALPFMLGWNVVLNGSERI